MDSYKQEWWEVFNDSVDEGIQLFGIRLYKYVEDEKESGYSDGYNDIKEICEGCFMHSYGDEIYTNDGDDWTVDDVVGEGIEALWPEGYACDDCGDTITHTGEISKSGRSLTIPTEWRG